jgi:hypothetical protein
MDETLYMLVTCVGVLCTPLTADFSLTRFQCVEEMKRSALPNLVCRSRKDEFGASRFGPIEDIRR